MHSEKKRNIRFLFLFLITLVLGDTMNACSCSGIKSVEAGIEHVDLVIAGRVIKAEHFSNLDSILRKVVFKNLKINADGNDMPTKSLQLPENSFSMGYSLYEVQVHELYKGEIKRDTLSILSASSDAACGYRFQAGEEYIIYAHEGIKAFKEFEDFYKEDFSLYRTNICTRTQIYDSKEIDEIRRLLPRKELSGNRPIEMLSFISPQVPPEYIDGGPDGLVKFIYDNLRYPEGQEDLKGRVIVGFEVSTEGLPGNIIVHRGLTNEADEEAIRLVRLLRFIPGTWHGKPTNVTYTLPILFNRDE